MLPNLSSPEMKLVKEKVKNALQKMKDVSEEVVGKK